MNIQRPSWAVGSPVSGKVFDILSRYLVEGSGSDQTATSLTAIFDEYMDSAENMENNLEYLWGPCLWFAKQLSHSDIQQDRLVELLQEIQKIPCPHGYSPESDPDSFYFFDELWLHMPGFISALVHFEVDAPLVPPLKYRPGKEHLLDIKPSPWSQELSATEWTNLSAFCARLHTASPHLIHIDIHGLWALLDALEEKQTTKTLDTLVPAAACWIIYAGTAIKNNSVEYAIYDDDEGGKRMPYSVGELYHGEKGFNEERWSFWKTRFRELSADEDLKSETRSFAERAWLEM